MTVHRKFKFYPSDALDRTPMPYRWTSYARRFAAYQWFVARLHEYMEKHPSEDEYRFWEYLNGTSSIHNSEPDPIHNQDEPFRRLRMLFMHVGTDSGRGKFLRYCKLRSWSDLDKGFIVPVAHTDDFPKQSWFELRGRKFKVSPNPSHPPATWIMSGAVEVNYAGDCWRVSIEYGYEHDSSHWFYRIGQRSGEDLSSFSKRVDTELEKLLEPETEMPSTRLQRDRDWTRAKTSVRELFYGDGTLLGNYDWDKDLATQLVTVPGTSLLANRIRLTKPRLRTLQRWIQESKVKNAANRN